MLGMNRPGFGLKTLGGRLDWTDKLIWSGWRIQENSKDGRCRLLDDKDRRMAVGSFEYCLKQLRSQPLRMKTQRHVVLVLHGLGASRHFMNDMEEHLRENGFDVVNFGYSSTHLTIEEITDSLECVVRNLPVNKLSIVAHSMGNIVVRHLLYRFQVCPDPPAIEFCRMVMISPPNQGAYLAGTLGQRPVIQSVFGPVVNQFAWTGGWPELEPKLAIPEFEFGIIAGGKGDYQGYLDRVPGDDDGLLSIDSHYLENATDFVQIGGLHQLMPHYKSVQRSTSHFLRHGYFPR